MSNLGNAYVVRTLVCKKENVPMRAHGVHFYKVIIGLGLTVRFIGLRLKELRLKYL